MQATLSFKKQLKLKRKPEASDEKSKEPFTTKARQEGTEEVPSKFKTGNLHFQKFVAQAWQLLR